MHQGKVSTTRIRILPGEGGFDQDGMSIQEIIARDVVLIDSNANLLEGGHSQDGTVPGQGAVFHLQAQELLCEYFRTDSPARDAVLGP